MATPKKEHPYRMSPRLEKVKANLVDNFGYSKTEAKELAIESCASLDKYVAVMEAMIRQQSIRLNGQEKNPTQTPYWKVNNG